MTELYRAGGCLNEGFVGQIAYTVCLDRVYEELDRLILHEAKAEIHIAVMMNDAFLGCVHRQLTDRHLHFTATEATEGCIPSASYFGVLKVIVLVFNVILDDTRYELSVSAR